jgi:hypothetical protein
MGSKTLRIFHCSRSGPPLTCPTMRLCDVEPDRWDAWAPRLSGFSTAVGQGPPTHRHSLARSGARGQHAFAPSWTPSTEGVCICTGAKNLGRWRDRAWSTYNIVSCMASADVDVDTDIVAHFDAASGV